LFQLILTYLYLSRVCWFVLATIVDRIVILPFSICPDVEDHSQGPVVSLAVVDGIDLLLIHLLIPIFSLHNSLFVSLQYNFLKVWGPFSEMFIFVYLKPLVFYWLLCVLLKFFLKMCINFSFNTATLASSLRLFMFDLLLSSFLIGSTLCIWSTQRMWSCWTKTRWQTLTHLYLLVHSLSWPPITNVVLLSSSFRLATGPLCSSSEESNILNSKKAFVFQSLLSNTVTLLENKTLFSWSLP